jgi:hypothetical protein
MKNTALGALIARSEANESNVSVVEQDNFHSGAPAWHPTRRIAVLQKLLLCGASLHAVKITFLSCQLAVMSVTHCKSNRFMLDFLSGSDLDFRIN